MQISLRQWRRWTGLSFAIILSIAVAAPRARADAPFYTDDPVFSSNWEIKAGITGEHKSGSSRATHVLDWNYAVVPNVRLNLTTYVTRVSPMGRGSQSGYGDTEFKIKWRFLDEDKSGARPALGIAPKVFIPTADASRGLGDGVWRFQVPLLFGKSAGRWYHFAEAGYQWALAPTVSNTAYGGAGTIYSFTDRFALGTELFGSISTQNRNDRQLLTTVGVIYTINAHWQLKASVSHKLRDTSRSGTDSAGVFYVVWNF